MFRNREFIINRLSLIALLFTTSLMCGQGLIPLSESELSSVAVWEPSENSDDERSFLAQGFALETEVIDTNIAFYSLERYCPAIVDQSIYNNCVGWSVAYYAMSTRLNYLMGLKDDNLKHIFSLDPNHLLISKSNSQELWKSSGSSFKEEFEYVRKFGAPFRINFSDANYDNNGQVSAVKIKSWNRLDLKKHGLEQVKSALFSGKPIVFGMAISDEFFKMNFEEDSAIVSVSEMSQQSNFQAMTIIGFNELVGGGAFEVVTSYGPQFGNGGKIYIKYDEFLSLVNEAYIFELDFPKYLQSGLENINLGMSVYEESDSGVEFHIIKESDDSYYIGGYKDGIRTGIGAEIFDEEIIMNIDNLRVYDGRFKSNKNGYQEFYDLISFFFQ